LFFPIYVLPIFPTSPDVSPLRHIFPVMPFSFVAAFGDVTSPPPSLTAAPSSHYLEFWLRSGPFPPSERWSAADRDWALGTSLPLAQVFQVSYLNRGLRLRVSVTLHRSSLDHLPFQVHALLSLPFFFSGRQFFFFLIAFTPSSPWRSLAQPPRTVHFRSGRLLLPPSTISLCPAPLGRCSSALSCSESPL